MVLRKRAGLSQIALGHLVGVSEISVYRYEHGVTTVPAEILMRIADALHVDVQQLYPDEETKEKTRYHVAETSGSEFDTGDESDPVSSEISMLITHAECLVMMRQKRGPGSPKQTMQQLDVLERHVKHIKAVVMAPHK